MCITRPVLSTVRLALFALFAIFFQAGCPSNPNPQMVIDSPANNTSITCVGMSTSCQVKITTRWTGIALGSPTMTLDGTTIPNAIQGNGTGMVQASLGQHTIVTFVAVNINNGVSHLSATSAFTLVPPPPTLILTPSNGVGVQAGSSASIKVTTDMPLTSPLTVTLTSDTPSVAKVGPAPGATTHTVTLPVSTGSMPGSAMDAVDGVGAGQANITASATGATTSAKLKVTVTSAPPPAPKAVVFRTSSVDVQSFAFSTTNTWSNIDTQAATASPGNFTVGLALGGAAAGPLFRTSASDIQTFTINTGSTLTLASSVSGTLSGTGSSIASSGTRVVRGSNSGIETFTLGGTTLTPAGSGNGGLSSTGVGVDVAGSVAVRVTGTGIEVFTLSGSGAPTSLGTNNTGAASSTAPSVKIFAMSTRAVRAHDSGIEIYDVTTSNVPRVGMASGGSSPSGAVVAVNAAGTLAVRAYSGGIEVYTLPATGNPLKVAALTNVALSATGVGVCLKGTNAFRATDSVVEAFDITGATMGTISALGQIGATLSPTGTGLVCR